MKEKRPALVYATRAEAAWTQMADRAERTRDQRDAREAAASAARLAASDTAA